jgi:hypothetical protein
MNKDTWYDDWKRRHGQGEPPPGFTDRLMVAVAAVEAQRQRSLWNGIVLALMSSRLSKIGICSLAAATCLFRLLHVVAIFIAQ